MFKRHSDESQALSIKSERRVSAVPTINQDIKLVKRPPKHMLLDQSLQNVHIPSDNNLNCDSKNEVYLFTCKILL